MLEVVQLDRARVKKLESQGRRPAHHSELGNPGTSLIGRFGATISRPPLSPMSRQRPVRLKRSSRSTGPCQCSKSADGSARPAAGIFIGNVSGALVAAAGGEAACMAGQPQSARGYKLMG